MSKQSTSEQNEEKEVKDTTDTTKKTCGIIMPIADHPDYPVGHWKEVLQIIKDSLSDTEFEVKLVSDSIEIGLIHERIVTNIYSNDIVICDVSSKNPNVMFELGMRLAFDKPIIIIKDETTGFSFDTSVIEHLPYQSSLRHSAIELFKQDLKRKVIGTYEKSNESEEYSPFLKSFGRTISPGKIKSTEISQSEYIIEKLEDISKRLSDIERKEIIDNTPQLVGRNNRSTYASHREMVKKNLLQSYSIQVLISALKDEVIFKEIIESLKPYYRNPLTLDDFNLLIQEIISEGKYY